MPFYYLTGVNHSTAASQAIALIIFRQGMGEAGVFLASSVFFAIRDAVAAARKERGLSNVFTLDSPLNVARIRMACADHLTEMVKPFGTSIAFSLLICRAPNQGGSLPLPCLMISIRKPSLGCLVSLSSVNGRA